MDGAVDRAVDQSMDRREHVVVCGVDGSPGSQLALRWAAEHAARTGCRLRAVTTWDWDGVEALGAAGSRAEALEQARSVQDRALERALAGLEQPPEVERLLPHDEASHALVQASLDAELLVLGSHGHGVVHDRLVGSTTQRTLHHASCPVVVLPSPRPSTERAERGRDRGRRAPSAGAG